MRMNTPQDNLEFPFVLYIKDLTNDVTEDKLKSFFSDCMILDLRFKQKFAYMHVYSSYDVQKALNKNCQIIPGTHCRISVSVSYRKLLPKAHDQLHKLFKEEVNIIWIGNIGKDVREQDIKEKLKQFESSILGVIVEPVKQACNETYGCIYLSAKSNDHINIISQSGNIILQNKPLKFEFIKQKKQGFPQKGRGNIQSNSQLSECNQENNSKSPFTNPQLHNQQANYNSYNLGPEPMFINSQNTITKLDLEIKRDYKPYMLEMEKKNNLKNCYNVSIAGLEDIQNDQIQIFGNVQAAEAVKKILIDTVNNLDKFSIKTSNEKFLRFMQGISKKNGWHYRMQKLGMQVHGIQIVGTKKSIFNFQSRFEIKEINSEEIEIQFLMKIYGGKIMKMVKEAKAKIFFDRKSICISGVSIDEIYGTIGSMLQDIRYATETFKYTESTKGFILKQLERLKTTLLSESAVIIDVKFHNGKLTVTIMFNNSTSYYRSKEKIEAALKIVSQKLPISSNISLRQYQVHLKNIEQEEDVIIKTEHDKFGNRSFIITGSADHVNSAIDRIKQTLEGDSTYYYPVPRFMHRRIINKKCHVYTSNLEKIKKECGLKYLEFTKLDRKGIKMIGKKDNIKQAITKFDKFVETLKNVIAVDIIEGFTDEMTKKLYDDDKLLREVRQTLEVDIKLPHPSDPSALKLQITNGQYVIQVRHGDITKCSNADVLVNSANGEMNHQGGVAKKISEEAGKSFEIACKKYVEFMGSVKVGDILVTPAYEIFFASYIFNAVCPVYGKGSEKMLETVCRKVLTKADELKAQCIAIPVLGSGIYNFPAGIACEIISKTCIDFMNRSPQHLKTIILIDSDESKVQELLMKIKTEAQISSVSWLGIPQALKSGVKKKDIWYWLDDDNQWKAFKKIYNNLLNEAYNSGKKRVNILIEGKQYLFDFSQLKQINQKTNYTRNIQKNVVTKQKGVQWYWRDDKNMFSPYNVQTSELIESHYRNGTRSFTVTLTRHADDIPQEYIIDLVNMEQINKNTNYKREIRREEIEFYSKPNQDDDDDDDDIDVAEEVPSCIRLFSLDASKLKDAKEKILKRKDEYITKKVVEVNKLSPSVIKKIAAKHHVQVTSQSNNRWELVGDRRQVDLAQYEISIEALKLEGETIYPKTWVLSSKKLELLPIKPNSEEWNFVLNMMKITLPNVNIIKIERVQNKDLWKYYSLKLNNIKERNNNRNMEYVQWLFHGTRNTSPSHIYEKGFDMRYCNGMWGQGVYFAVNASYSNSYVHNSPQGKQMFLSRVIVGDFCVSQPNSSLRFPPYKDQARMIMHDSVKGHTGGSDVFIIYDNCQAYPEYLITYTTY